MPRVFWHTGGRAGAHCARRAHQDSLIRAFGVLELHQPQSVALLAADQLAADQLCRCVFPRQSRQTMPGWHGSSQVFLPSWHVRQEPFSLLGLPISRISILYSTPVLRLGPHLCHDSVRIYTATRVHICIVTRSTSATRVHICIVTRSTSSTRVHICVVTWSTSVLQLGAHLRRDSVHTG